jgi:hypothetical protein
MYVSASKYVLGDSTEMHVRVHFFYACMHAYIYVYTHWISSVMTLFFLFFILILFQFWLYSNMHNTCTCSYIHVYTHTCKIILTEGQVFFSNGLDPIVNWYLKRLKTVSRPSVIFEIGRTDILIMIEVHKTAFNGFQYQFTTAKSVEKPETDPQLLWGWR